MVGCVLLTSDITRQRSLEAELRQAEKLKAVGTLASGIAHDFNNILATIFTSTEVALLHLADGCAGTRAAGPGHERRQARAAAGRRDPDLQPQRADTAGRDRPRCRSRRAIDLCRPAIGSRVELRYDQPGEAIFVAADETQIHQIVSNLCLNAAQAMPDGGKIAVRVDSGEGGDGQRRAKLRVADTGSGMDAETAARAFEPFFTTKPVGEGTGLGLAVVHGTVKALGGRIRLRTAPGRGSVFAITLPCIGREGADRAAPTEVIPAGHGRTVFLVEPDDEAAEAVGVILRDRRLPRDAAGGLVGHARGFLRLPAGRPAGVRAVAARAERHRARGGDASAGAGARCCPACFWTSDLRGDRRRRVRGRGDHRQAGAAP